MGTATLVLGILSLVLLLACGLGILIAIVGIILGIVAIAKGSGKTKAIIGMCLSGLTLLIALVGGILFYNWFESKHLGECLDTRLYPTQEAAQRCVEEKLNQLQSPSGI
jgi:hypothetical protein